MAKISDIEIPSLLFDEQVADPTTPASGFGRLYVKAGALYFIDDAGAVTGPLGAAGGGSGITQAYLGYNTIGGSSETVTANLWYMKKISPANDCLITDIEVYCKYANDFGSPLAVALFSDSSGPARLLAGSEIGLNLDISDGGGTFTPRWFSMPLGRWVTAGDYWIGFAQQGTARLIAYYDTGTDVTYQAAGDYMTDPTHGTRTVTSNKYSIRANTIR